MCLHKSSVQMSPPPSTIADLDMEAEMAYFLSLSREEQERCGRLAANIMADLRIVTQDTAVAEECLLATAKVHCEAEALNEDRELAYYASPSPQERRRCQRVAGQLRAPDQPGAPLCRPRHRLQLRGTRRAQPIG